jgi:hypothetical protein
VLHCGKGSAAVARSSRSLHKKSSELSHPSLLLLRWLAAPLLALPLLLLLLPGPHLHTQVAQGPHPFSICHGYHSHIALRPVFQNPAREEGHVSYATALLPLPPSLLLPLSLLLLVLQL